MNLASLTIEYLKAAGYMTTQRGRDLIVGTRRTSVGHEDEVILVWVPIMDARRLFQPQEGPYLARFQGATEEYPQARKFMLVPTFEQMTSGFRQAAKQIYNVNIRVPIQFFDAPFVQEESPGRVASSKVRELVDRAEEKAPHRVPQPFTSHDASGKGQDLLAVLTEQLQRQIRPSDKNVHIVVGPAGAGKSILFEALFARLYRDFIEDKRRLTVVPRPRPLPVLPEYLPAAVAPTLRALVDAFIATEIAAPVTRPVFEWMLSNGFAAWLLDGLDEIISRDQDFFTYLLEVLTNPGTSPPRIVICVRDSLLTTNDDLREFCESYSANIQIYELAKWDTTSKKEFAKKVLGAAADGFMARLRQSPTLSQLSSTPYYCSLMAEQYQRGLLPESATESQLLDGAVSSMVDREYGKGLLDEKLMPKSAVKEFLEALAADDLEGGFQGFHRDSVEEWARILLPVDITEADLEKLVVGLMQLAIFTRSALAGKLLFAQEILEQYLLGEYLARCLVSDPNIFVRRMSHRQIPSEWITFTVLSERLREQGRSNDIVPLLWKPMPDAGFRNIVQATALAVEDKGVLRTVPFERRDLAGVVFRDLDLHGVSFRGADLTDVQFERCDLKQAIFEGAILKNTAFAPKTPQDLRGARFGDMERFYSIRIGSGKAISDLSHVKQWIDEHTGIIVEPIEPCDAARQLRYLFGKFIHPNGAPKRATLDRRGVLSGKPFYDPEKTLKAAVKFGYLTEEERFRDRITRAEGDAYDEMIAFVRDLALSDTIKALLDVVCPKRGCPHVPLSSG